MAEEIMTIEECAKYLKTSVSTIYRLAQEGKIPSTEVENMWRFRKEKIDEWLEKGGNLENYKQKAYKKEVQNETVHIIVSHLGISCWLYRMYKKT